MRTAKTGRCGNCGKVHHTLNAALMCEAAHNAMALVADALALPDATTCNFSRWLEDERIMYEAKLTAPSAKRLEELVRL